MKKMKKWLLSVLIMCMMAMTLSVQQISAAEAEGTLETTSVVRASSGNYGNLANASFTSTELRDGSAVNFSGSNGKVNVFIFGGIGSCSNTRGAISRFDELTDYLDMSKVNIYAFDIKGNSTSTILETLESVDISDNIQVGELTSSVTSVRRTCASYAGLSEYYLPFIVYVNAEGVMYDYTTSVTDTETIIEKLRAGGLEVDYVGEVLQKLNVTGEISYTYAYEILDYVNAARAENGLAALTMDQELLNAAMQRAAECAIYYSHTRPDGTDCFTASSKMSRENIAAGYQTPAAVMEGWLNSSGHYANIMASDNLSVGVGCFKMEGVWYWVQCFGRTAATSAQNSGQGYGTFEVEASDIVVADVEFSGGYVDEGATAAVSVVVINEWSNSSWAICTIDNDSYQWSSSSGNIATVNSDGIITGRNAGTATITGVNIGNPAKVLTYTIIVEEPETGSSGGSTGGAGNGSNNNSGNSTYTGLLQGTDGNWYYYNNGSRDRSYTGLYYDTTYGWWLVNNGVVAFDYNGLYCDATYGWWLIEGGTPSFGYTGLYCDATYGWWLIGNGSVAFGYNGLWNDPTYGWWLVEGGAPNFGYTGLYYDSNCGWWLIGGGSVCFGYNGLWNDPNYGWWLVEGGTPSFGYTGLYYDANCGWWLIGNGSVAFDYYGLWNDANYGWWYVEGGAPNFGYTGLVANEYGWWYVENGAIDFTFTGFVANEYGWWYVENGAINFNYTGVISYGGVNYYVVNGAVS